MIKNKLMAYIDVLIPLALGLLLFLAPNSLIPTTDAASEKKKRLLKVCGLVLVGVGILYLIIKLVGI